MALYKLGSLPGSKLHVGVSLALPPLISALGDADGIQANVEAAATALLELPDVPAFSAEIQAALDAVGEIDFGELAAAGSLSIVAELEANAALAAKFGEIVGTLSVALGGSGVAAYRYTGDAAGLGQTLGTVTNDGVAVGQPDNTVDALILASSDPVEWQTLSILLGPAGAPPVAGDTDRRVETLGLIGGPGLHIGLVACVPAFQTLITNLAAAFASLIVTQVEFSLTASVPLDPVSVTIGLQAQLAGLATIAALPAYAAKTQLDLGIDASLQVGVGNLLRPIVGELQAGLAGSGVIAYRYHGPANLLASELSRETSDGLAGGNPQDAVKALVLATGDPSEWASLSAALFVE